MYIYIYINIYIYTWLLFVVRPAGKNAHVIASSQTPLRQNTASARGRSERVFGAPPGKRANNGARTGEEKTCQMIANIIMP